MPSGPKVINNATSVKRSELIFEDAVINKLIEISKRVVQAYQGGNMPVRFSAWMVSILGLFVVLNPLRLATWTSLDNFII